MTDHPNLPTALAAFQAEVPTVAKTKRADVPTKSGGKFSYTYADLAAVTEVAMPLLAKHGLSFVTTPRTGADGWELRGLLLHTSGERLRGSLPIRGNSPQEIGSSLTYMRRYLFGCLTGVVTEDDDDGATGGRTRKEQPATDAPQPQATRRMSRPSDTTPETITHKQSQAMHALFNEAGITQSSARHDYCTNLIGRELASSSDLTVAEASRVIDALKKDAEGA